VKENARFEKVAEWRDSFPPNIIVTESNEAKFMRHASYYILVGKPEEKRFSADLFLGRRIILKRNIKAHCEGFCWFRIWPCGGFLLTLY
jgi:hypothetical protein